MIKLTGKASDFLKIGVAAAARNDLDAVRELLRLRPEWIHHVGSHGRTMLWEACHRGKLPMVKYLVRRKADINAYGSHYTPYFVDISCYCIARFKKRTEVADFLLEKGAKQNIHTAAFLGDLKQVKAHLKSNRKLLHAGHPQHVMAEKNEQGLEFVAQKTDWAIPLCYALRGGDHETCEYLINRGSKIKGFEQQLFNAADDAPALVEMLLAAGANPKHAPDVFPTDKEMQAVVSKYGKRTSKKVLNEELVYLCRGDRGGNPEQVVAFLEAGANVNHQDKKGKTALHRAAKAGFVKTVQILLESGAELEIEDAVGDTPLFDAVRSTIKDVESKKKTIRLLIRAGANRSHKNVRGQTVAETAKLKKDKQESAAIVRILHRK